MVSRRDWEMCTVLVIVLMTEHEIVILLTWNTNILPYINVILRVRILKLQSIAPDKSRYLENIFLLSPRKHM